MRPPSLARSRELWGRLLTFHGTSRWYRTNFEKWLRAHLPPDTSIARQEIEMHLARWLLREPQGNGGTILDRFVDGLPRKAQEDRAIASRWMRSWDALLQLQEVVEGGWRCFDLVSCRLLCLDAPSLQGLPAAPRGGFLQTFVVTSDDDWCFLGGNAGRFLDSGQGGAARDLAHRMRLGQSAFLLRDSAALRDESLRIRRAFVRRFAARFGGAEWLTTGAAYAREARAFFAVLEQEGRDGDRAAADYVPWHEIFLEQQMPLALPRHMEQSEDVAVLCDEGEEPLVLAEYGRFKRALEADDPETVPGWRKKVRSYLMDPTVSDLPFRVALARNEAQVLDRVRQALELSNLTREGLETMIQQAKGQVLVGHHTPTWLPAPDWSALLPEPAATAAV